MKRSIKCGLHLTRGCCEFHAHNSEVKFHGKSLSRFLKCLGVCGVWIKCDRFLVLWAIVWSWIRGMQKFIFTRAGFTRDIHRIKLKINFKIQAYADHMLAVVSSAIFAFILSGLKHRFSHWKSKRIMNFLSDIFCCIIIIISAHTHHSSLEESHYCLLACYC